jgi:branched-chain amino acid transport system permease protein
MALTWILTRYVFSVSLESVAVHFVIFTGLVIAIQSFTGNSGILSLGHFAIFAVGAYVAAFATIPAADLGRQAPSLPSWVVNLSVSAPEAILLAGAAGLVFGLVVGLFISKMEPLVAIMATLAMLIAMYTVFNSLSGVTSGPRGISGIPTYVDISGAVVVTTLIAGAALTFWASPIGLRLEASREDGQAASALGIYLPRARYWGWLMSSFLAGIAGGAWALTVVAFAPEQVYLVPTFATVAMLVVGGMNSVGGAVFGALFISVVQELVSRGQDAIASAGGPQLTGIIEFATAVVIVVALAFRPNGLLSGTGAGLRVWFARRMAR